MIPDYLLGHTLDITRVLFAFFFFLIFLDARNRLSPYLKPEWDANYLSKHLPRRGIASSMSKVINNVLNRDKYGLAKIVMMELCRDASIFFNKPSNYFLGIRRDLPEIRQYFQNKELISFLYNPDIWVDKHLQKYHGGFAFRKNKTVTPIFLDELQAILDLFFKEILASKSMQALSR